MRDSNISSCPGVKTENDGSTSGSEKAFVEVRTQELTGVDIMIMVGDNKANVLWVKLKNQKQYEIVPLFEPEGLSCVM